MPLPPPPLTYRCPSCHWSKTVVPRSDVLMLGIDHFRACPACGDQPLRSEPAGKVGVMVAELAQQIGRWVRK